MIVGLLITDGGPHPPEKLAGATVQRICDDFREHAPNAAYHEVMEFRDRIDKLLSGHHRMIQDAERSALRTEGPGRLSSRIDTDAFIPDALDDLLHAANEKVDGNPRWPTLAGYFTRPETQRYFTDILHMEFHQNIHIERSWHADAHPDHQTSRAFHAVSREGHALLMMSDDDLKEHGGRELVIAVAMNTIPKRAS
jgi:hypothetical protein